MDTHLWLIRFIIKNKVMKNDNIVTKTIDEFLDLECVTQLSQNIK